MGCFRTRKRRSARVDIIHSQIAKFAIDWLSLEVQPGRIQALTTQAPSVRIRDLMLRTFKEFLPHTPLNKLGINRQVHFKLPTVELRHSIGYKLAPPEAWGEWARQIKAGKGVTRGGMTSVGMRQQDVDDGRPKGFIQAKVEPSTKIPGHVGVFVEVNDHYEISSERTEGCDEIMNLLDSNFDRSIERSEFIIDQVMRLRDV
jgi:hypothetical protein